MNIFIRIIKNLLGMYDLETLEGINSIPVPAKDGLEYDLQRKATQHKRDGRMDLAIACLYKSNQLMPHAGMTYSKHDYLRLVSYLEKAGRFDEADKERLKIEKMFKGELPPNLKRMNGSDLVIIYEHHPTCAECAKYHGRVYSVSGNDKRFPKLPEHIRKTGLIHPGCSHIIGPYDVNYVSTQEHRNNLINSKRPFIDNRPSDEQQLYEQKLYERMVDDYDFNNYNKLVRLLPAYAPKSYTGYRRMKNANSRNYQKLMSEAAAIGLNIDEHRIDGRQKLSSYASKQQNDIAIASIISVVEDCERIIDNTKNIDTFFSRYDLLVEQLNNLISEYNYSSDRLNQHLNTFPEKLQICIGKAVDDLMCLKTINGMQRRIDNIIEVLNYRINSEKNTEWIISEKENCSALYDLKMQLEARKKQEQ